MTSACLLTWSLVFSASRRDPWWHGPFPSSALAHGSPDLALPLFLAGVFLVYAEFNRPGTVLLGSVGMLCAMLALYALHPGPACIALSAASILLILLDLRVSTRLHVWALCGTVLLSETLFRKLSPPPGVPNVHRLTTYAVSISFTVVTLWLGRVALLARRNKAIRRPARERRSRK